MIAVDDCVLVAIDLGNEMTVMIALLLGQAKPTPFLDEINAFVKADREKPP